MKFMRFFVCMPYRLLLDVFFGPEEKFEYVSRTTPCPYDTNGDGDCGKRYCLHCGEDR